MRGHGEGTVFRRSRDGAWVAQISIGGGKRRSRIAATRQEAQRCLADLRREAELGREGSGRELRVGEWLERWVASVEHQLEPGTWRNYRDVVRKHLVPAVGKLPLSRLTPGHLEALYREKVKVLSPNTVIRIHAVAHRALGEAVRLGYVARNVADVARKPKAVRREMATLDLPQLATLLRGMRGDELEALYLTALGTGLRQGELLGLRWQDVDLVGGMVSVRQKVTHLVQGTWRFSAPKTRSGRRSVGLPALAVVALRRHRVRQDEGRLALGAAWRDLDLVFCAGDGTPLRARWVVLSRWRPLLKGLGLPRMRFHDLRHQAASLMASGGVHPRVMQEVLGHASASITMDVYAHVLPNMQAGVVTALDGLFARLVADG